MTQDLSKDEIKGIARDAGQCDGCKWDEAGQCILTGDCHRVVVDPKDPRDPPRFAEAPALAVQIGGGHYKDMAIQPVEYIYKNGVGYIEGSVIKYVSRWRKKNGVEDLKKARHFLDLLIEMEEAMPSPAKGPC